MDFRFENFHILQSSVAIVEGFLYFQEMKDRKTLGFGGGCHWCTEAVFQHLKGVEEVEQGYIASCGAAEDFSEAVLVHFNPRVISPRELIEIHVQTHRATSQHSFRKKYRSAIYYPPDKDPLPYEKMLSDLQTKASHPLITQVLPIRAFRSSRSALHNYYQKHCKGPFSTRYIEPKLEILRKKYPNFLSKDHS